MKCYRRIMKIKCRKTLNPKWRLYTWLKEESWSCLNTSTAEVIHGLSRLCAGNGEWKLTKRYTDHQENGATTSWSGRGVHWKQWGRQHTVEQRGSAVLHGPLVLWVKRIRQQKIFIRFTFNTMQIMLMSLVNEQMTEWKRGLVYSLYRHHCKWAEFESRYCRLRHYYL